MKKCNPITKLVPLQECKDNDNKIIDLIKLRQECSLNEEIAKMFEEKIIIENNKK